MVSLTGCLMCNILMKIFSDEKVHFSNLKLMFVPSSSSDWIAEYPFLFSYLENKKVYIIRRANVLYFCKRVI